MNNKKKSKVIDTFVEEVEKCKIVWKFESMTKKGHPKFWRMKRKILG